MCGQANDTGFNCVADYYNYLNKMLIAEQILGFISNMFFSLLKQIDDIDEDVLIGLDDDDEDEETT